jgi:CheY-like chemotaxis protein
MMTEQNTAATLKQKALVIEDHPDQGMVFRSALGLAGYDVELIADGSQAILRLQDTRPALVVLDMHLPGISGDKILEHIFAMPHLKDVNVIVATADDRMAETLRDKVILTLLKPVSFLQLWRLAERLQGKSTDEIDQAMSKQP